MLLKVQVNGSIEDRGGIVGDAQQVHGVLDLRGWRCPWCILKAQSRLRGMKQGQILEVLLSDPDVEWHFPRILENSQDRLIGLECCKDGLYRVRILRGRSA
ncbi:MAG: sulfurtransferase TusA family protein [Deltaproteobacteria bacterium]|nr:sulfurtransferase TusA family protein [Deltaproteobacteria bacterium]